MENANSLSRQAALEDLLREKGILSVRGEQIYIFSIFNFNVSIGMLLKGMVESSLLFEDEPLTPNIDKVMPV